MEVVAEFPRASRKASAKIQVFLIHCLLTLLLIHWPKQGTLLIPIKNEEIRLSKLKKYRANLYLLQEATKFNYHLQFLGRET
jgi:hypothetical protein